MNRIEDWIESRLMNAKIKNAPDTVTSWVRPRKKYFFLRISAATQGHIGQTFKALLSWIRSSDVILTDPLVQKVRGTFCTEVLIDILLPVLGNHFYYHIRYAIQVL